MKTSEAEIRLDLGISNTGPKGGLKKGWAGDVVEKYITGFKEQAFMTLSKFTWGSEFFRINKLE